MIMTMFVEPPLEPWDTLRWWDDASVRRHKQEKRTDKTAKTIINKDITEDECCKMLGCSLHEWYVLVLHYYGSEYSVLTEGYITYFVYEVMGNDDDKVNEWLVKQRQSFKYASLFEKLFRESEKIPKRQMVDVPLNPIKTIANTLKITEKEYVRLLVEYLGNPPFLVEDYESIDWEV